MANKLSRWLVWLTIVLSAAAPVVLGVARSAHAQTPAPTATPDAVSTLQAQANAQATEIANLTADVNRQLQQTQLDLLQKYLPLTIAAVVFAILGLTVSPLAALKYARDRAQKLIDDAIYKVDPTHIPLHIPEKDFEQERQFLQRSGFYQIETYHTLDNTCLNGCVIVVAPKLNDDPKSSDADTARFRRFLENNSPQVDKVGYVIYTKWRADPNLVELFPNITFANSPVTLGTNVFTVARSLSRGSKAKARLQ